MSKGATYGDVEHGLLYELAVRAGLVDRATADEAAPPPEPPSEKEAAAAEREGGSTEGGVTVGDPAGEPQIVNPQPNAVVLSADERAMIDQYRADRADGASSASSARKSSASSSRRSTSSARKGR